jgi:hypothetical protein
MDNSILAIGLAGTAILAVLVIFINLSNRQMVVWLFLAGFFPYKQIELFVIGSRAGLENIFYVVLFAVLLKIYFTRKQDYLAPLIMLPKGIHIMISTYAILSIISGYINHVDIPSIIYSLRWWVLFYLLIVSYHGMKLDIRRTILIFYYIALLQIPITILQRVFYVLLWNYGSGDWVTGTFPEYYQLVFYQFAMMGIFIYHSRRGYIRSRNIMIKIVLLTLPLALSNAKIVWLLLLLFIPVFMYYGGYSVKQNIKKAAVVLVFMGLIYTVFISLYRQDYNDSQQSLYFLFNPKWIASYSLADKSKEDIIDSKYLSKYDSHRLNHLGRYGMWIYNYETLKKSELVYLFGNGPPDMKHNEKKFYISNRYYISGGAMFNYYLGGMGIFGILWFLAFSAYLLRIYNKTVVAPVLFVAVVLSFYYSTFSSPVTFVLLSFFTIYANTQMANEQLSKRIVL